MNRFDMFAKAANQWINQHSGPLLMGCGIATGILTTGLAVAKTPEAMRRIDEKKKELNKDHLTLTETVEACWKCYIPSALTGGVSVICLVSSSAISEKRNAALVAAYSVSEAARLNYRDKVVEVIGEKKEQEVRDAIAKDEIRKHPVKDSEVILTQHGNTLCFEPLSGRYFRSSVEKLKRAENELNRKLLDEMYISLNDFYDEVGLSHNELGDVVGWNTDKVRFIRLWFSSQLTPDNEPCLMVSFESGPVYDYDKLY